MKTLNRLCEGTDCREIFQKEIFGWISQETDTDDEALIRKAVIKGWISANIATPKVIKAFQQLMKCKSKYPLALKPRTGERVYRGFGNQQNVEAILKSANQSDFKKDGDRYFFNKNYVYKPHRPLQSFSRTLRAAEEFAYSGYHNMVFITNTNKDFIFTKDFMEYMEDQVWLTGEDEIVRVSKKPMKGSLRINVDTYNMAFNN